MKENKKKKSEKSIIYRIKNVVKTTPNWLIFLILASISFGIEINQFNLNIYIETNII